MNPIEEFLREERSIVESRVGWMRELGVMSARFTDGLQLVLGPELAPPPAPLRSIAPALLSDEEVATREARKQERERAVALAATGRVV